MEATIEGVSAPVARKIPVTRRERWAWYLYDFGNSAYAAVVLMAVYSAYFKQTVVGGAEGSRLWGVSVSIAMLFVALTTPILGTIADFAASKKRFLNFYTGMVILFTAALYFVVKGDVLGGMFFFILAEIGYRSAQVFYNALLPEIAEPEEMGTVSGNGWAIGSAGGIICLVIVLALVTLVKGTLVVRLSFFITAVFFTLSSLPIFMWVRERAVAKPLPPGETYFSLPFRRLAHTFKAARSHKEFIKFIIAYIVYNNGIIITFDFAAIIGAVLFGLTQQQLIVFMMIVQVTSVLGAWLTGIIADRAGGKVALLFSLVMMVGVVILLMNAQNILVFYIIGALAGFALTGVQSVSRMMVGQLAPQNQAAEFYGLFAFASSASAFIGPAVFGFLSTGIALSLERRGWIELTAEQTGMRYALLAVVTFLVIGLGLLLFVKNKRAEARPA